MSVQLPVYIFSFLAAGLLTGFLSGLFGIGGIVRIPIFFLVYISLGIDVSVAGYLAVGTSLALGIPTSFITSVNHYRTLDRKVVYFIKRWLPPLVLGSICAVMILRFISNWLLLGAFSLVVLFIAVQALVFKDDFVFQDRFSSRIIEAFVAFVTGVLSTISGVSIMLSRSVLTSFWYSYEATYASPAGGLLISVIGTLGFMVHGLDVSGRPFSSVGYVDLLAVLISLPAMYLAAWLGKKVGVSQGFLEFRKSIIQGQQTDKLTGLYNRRYFDRMLDYSTTYADKSSETVSVLMIDIDKLTDLSEKYGQQAANIVKVSLGRALTESVGDAGIIARYGGDEFTVILPKTTKNNSIAVAEQIMAKLRTIEISTKNGTLPVSFSIGISTYSSGESDRSSLAQYAELAAYESKRAGRGRITHYEDISI